MTVQQYDYQFKIKVKTTHDGLCYLVMTKHSRHWKQIGRYYNASLAIGQVNQTKRDLKELNAKISGTTEDKK